MASLRFSAEALEALQRAHRALAMPGFEATYQTIVSTLISLERDAALFTLLEASPLPGAPPQTYGVSINHVDVSYQLSAVDEDVVVWSIRYQ